MALSSIYFIDTAAYVAKLNEPHTLSVDSNASYSSTSAKSALSCCVGCLLKNNNVAEHNCSAVIYHAGNHICDIISTM
jgi:hypothetical protein